MDQKQLNKIKERIEKASQGVWELDPEDKGIWNKNGLNYLGRVTLPLNDAEFIANAREDVSNLITEVERLNNRTIVKHFCKATFIGEYSLNSILEEGKVLSNGSLFTVHDKEYLVLNIMIRGESEIVVETKSM
ncbi:hypothetical protein [Lysinibacillus fusiformis]|uniref:hypothetical protein n=1 Tax=Lysinibacillus fusiformis TaxID=28031 RepID=UPI00263B2B70|nr:hypothetical protein [Lysinibacillus fusiformis]MDC6267245.1 hypothetical protein [Lysinibacillus sphaericus]MDN4968321.1 hypothetical protein [Lysinibacillus fusiformis]MDN4968495.1 hypothetical protein [Lysinibacillus fusiformis]